MNLYHSSLMGIEADYILPFVSKTVIDMNVQKSLQYANSESLTCVVGAVWLDHMIVQFSAFFLKFYIIYKVVAKTEILNKEGVREN